MATPAYFLFGGDVVTPTGIIPGGSVYIKDGVLVRVRELRAAPAGAESIDVSGKLVFPGFVDLHVHGAGGIDVMDAEPSGLRKMAKTLAYLGTTTYVPTLRSAPLDSLPAVIRQLADLRATPFVGAKIAGVHLEGPMLNPNRRGIHAPASLAILTADFIEPLLREFISFIKIITLAPELDKNLALCQYLVENKVLVSLGHSEADYALVKEGVERGLLNYAVHTYNAMPQLHHRDPGPLGALLTEEKITCEVIADGRHVHSAALKILYRCKGAEKIVLATDAMLPLGTRTKRFTLEGKEFIVQNGVPLTTKGAIAGSILTLPQAALIFAQATGCPLNEAVNMASLNPARLLGWDKQLGSLEEGKLADVVVTDHKGKVETVFIDGFHVK